MFSEDGEFVVIEEKVRAVAIDISHEKFTQAFESLATHFEAINALYEEMLDMEKRWREAFSELDEAVKGLTSDEDRWAFMTALTQLNARNMRVMAAEEGAISDVYDYRYGEEPVGESMQTSWDRALELDPEALEVILGESEAAQKWLAKLDQRSVVRVVRDGKRTAVLHWRPDDEADVVQPDYVGATQASLANGES